MAIPAWLASSFPHPAETVIGKTLGSGRNRRVGMCFAVSLCIGFTRGAEGANGFALVESPLCVLNGLALCRFFCLLKQRIVRLHVLALLGHLCLDAASASKPFEARKGRL